MLVRIIRMPFHAVKFQKKILLLALAIWVNLYRPATLAANPVSKHNPREGLDTHAINHADILLLAEEHMTKVEQRHAVQLDGTLTLQTSDTSHARILLSLAMTATIQCSYLTKGTIVVSFLTV